ncbi:MAG: hypothetical protein HY075_15860 [Deltaproteobacteria bacterium]|nr:hypothetical protein [Deltaproteobacteria bacterium]
MGARGISTVTAFALAMLALAGASVRADDDPDCPEVRFDDFYMMPAREQGATETCASQSSAALIDFYRIQNVRAHPEARKTLTLPMQPDQQTSAMSLAVHDAMYTEKLNKAYFGYASGVKRAVHGVLSGVSDAKKPYPTCTVGKFAETFGVLRSLVATDSKALDADLIGYVQGNPPPPADAAADLNSLVQDLARYVCKKQGDDPLTDARLQHAQTACPAYRSLSLAKLRDLAVQTFKSLFPCEDKRVGANEQEGVVNDFLGEKCKDCDTKQELCAPGVDCAPPFAAHSLEVPFRPVLDGKGGYSALKGEPDKAYGGLMSMLKSKNPVVIGFCAAVIGRPGRPSDPDSCKNDWTSNANALRKADPKMDPGPVPNGHAAVVMGSHKVGGKCRLLIHNSWGPDCGGTLDCDGHGNQWVDADLVKRALTAVDYIVPKGASDPLKGSK